MSNPNTAQPNNEFGGMPGLGTMPGLFDPQMLQNPAIQNMVSQMMSNPQLLQQIISNNPMLQQLTNSNPQLLEMMSRPEFIQQMSNPQFIQSALQMQQSGLFGQFPNQNTSSASTAQQSTAQQSSPDMFSPDWASLNNMMTQLNGTYNPSNNLQNNNNNVSFNNTSQQQPQSLEDKYATQIQQLKEMGFYDPLENINALVATNGNVNAAVERLLSNL